MKPRGSRSGWHRKRRGRKRKVAQAARAQRSSPWKPEEIVDVVELGTGRDPIRLREMKSRNPGLKVEAVDPALERDFMGIRGFREDALVNLRRRPESSVRQILMSHFLHLISFQAVAGKHGSGGPEEFISSKKLQRAVLKRAAKGKEIPPQFLQQLCRVVVPHGEILITILDLEKKHYLNQLKRVFGEENVRVRSATSLEMSSPTSILGLRLGKPTVTIVCTNKKEEKK